ncbi:hypothetical protein GS534_24135 [Rhodococcus hoagii]|nr:hypothetical protein [Prescottella equi]MBM4613727.1 hypothetical protein [Prescottella equi]MBM4613730.1 hypothetical protein [Prescottella equi]MBM4618000.1 hypothetical protein [Prescottella equi]NKS33119.1 hypothetical protein [Prescottella equi]
MALGDPYITVPELRAYLQIPEDMTQMDGRLQDAAQSASREVEQFTGRQFNKVDLASPRRYSIDRRGAVRVDDFYTLDGLVVESGDGYSSWEGIGLTEFTPAPYDGIVDGLPWPYYRLEFPYRRLGVSGPWGPRVLRVTAKWGWPSVPATIKQATFLIAAQTFRLAEAPLGVTGNTQYGGVVRVQDIPQVHSKLLRYKTDPILVG